jgi:hypothetical protein
MAIPISPILLSKSTYYKIYGIFDITNKKLLYVSMDLEPVELEFDLESYDTGKYAVVSFGILLH